MDIQVNNKNKLEPSEDFIPIVGERYINIDNLKIYEVIACGDFCLKIDNVNRWGVIYKLVGEDYNLCKATTLIEFQNKFSYIYSDTVII